MFAKILRQKLCNLHKNKNKNRQFSRAEGVVGEKWGRFSLCNLSKRGFLRKKGAGYTDFLGPIGQKWRNRTENCGKKIFLPSFFFFSRVL